MGTRNLTMVISGEKTKVAQYGQWDGYPEGQGATIFEFLKTTDLDQFRKRLESTRFMTEDDEKEVTDFLSSIGSDNGWLNMEQAEKYHEAYPLLSRDNGAGVLQMMMESKDDIVKLKDSTSFKEDGLFCEWWYKIDLDKMTLGVYDGPEHCVKEFDINKIKNMEEEDFLFLINERLKELYPENYED